VKLHIAVDVLGFPYAAMVTTANISDIAGGIQMFSQHSFYSFSTVKTALCDGTYEGENFKNAIKGLIGADVEVVKRSELHTFAVIPKRWIVERSFGWLKFAFVSILLRRL